MASYGGGHSRSTAPTSTSMRRRVGKGCSGTGINVMLQIYSDDETGTKIAPVTVLIMSIGFVAFVALLHVLGKFYFTPRVN